MSKEKSYLKEIIVGSLATVLGSIILGLIPVTRNYASSLFSLVSKFFQAVWNFLISEINLPWIVIGILFLLAIPTIITIARKFIPKSEAKAEVYEAKLQDYIEDEFFGVVWRWDNNGAIGYCPNCQTRVVYNLGYGHRGIETSLYCETCSRTITTLEGNTSDILGKVARQIERKINTGEWKKIVERKEK